MWGRMAEGSRIKSGQVAGTPQKLERRRFESVGRCVDVQELREVQRSEI